MRGSKLTLLHPDFPAPFAEKAIRFVFGSLDIPAENQRFISGLLFYSTGLCVALATCRLHYCNFEGSFQLAGIESSG